jgi:nickel-dependent lactate racemase
MKLKELSFKYGKTEIHFSLEETLIIGELALRNPAIIRDPVAAVKEKIRNPIGTPPLREMVKPGQTVAFIVNDLTRLANTHIFLPVLLNELNEAGVRDKDMFVIFALGAHPLNDRTGDDRGRRI